MSKFSWQPFCFSENVVEFALKPIEMSKPIRVVQGARRKLVNFLRLFVFFNLAQFWDILALFHKVMVSEVCMSPKGDNRG